jgi:hypothetical protein
MAAARSEEPQKMQMERGVDIGSLPVVPVEAPA